MTSRDRKYVLAKMRVRDLHPPQKGCKKRYRWEELRGGKRDIKFYSQDGAGLYWGESRYELARPNPKKKEIPHVLLSWVGDKEREPRDKTKTERHFIMQTDSGLNIR